MVTVATDTERSDFVRRSLTDLHTHILPQMDDGAINVEMACAMLRKEKANGVTRVMLTPHFYPLRESMEDFLYRRSEAWNFLVEHWDGARMPQIQLGAEVRYSAELLNMDLSQLTLGGSEYLLLELSDRRLPAHLHEVLDRMLMMGITPILAHVERCMYFREEPERLLRLVELGALMQVSAGAVLDKKDRGFAKACLRKGIAQFVASDAHNLTDRAPSLNAALRRYDEDLILHAESAARKIWNHQPLSGFEAYPIRKTIFGYK